MLKTEINTPAMEKRIRRAANFRLKIPRSRMQTDFEHGQWWVTDLRSGAQWSAVDCETQDGVFYFDFEQVSAGDAE